MALEADGSARQGLPDVGVGDLAELAKDLVQQIEVPATEVLLPFGKDLIERRPGHLDRSLAATLDHDQPRAPVRWVGGSSDVAEAFQLID